MAARQISDDSLHRRIRVRLAACDEPACRSDGCGRGRVEVPLDGARLTAVEVHPSRKLDDSHRQWHTSGDTAAAAEAIHVAADVGGGGVVGDPGAKPWPIRARGTQRPCHADRIVKPTHLRHARPLRQRGDPFHHRRDRRAVRGGAARPTARGAACPRRLEGDQSHVHRCQTQNDEEHPAARSRRVFPPQWVWAPIHDVSEVRRRGDPESSPQSPASCARSRRKVPRTPRLRLCEPRP
jgi:hypothetical protein